MKPNVKTEVIAGITTFFTMLYIVIVNPSILSTPGTGMPFSGVMTATVLLSFLMTLLMGVYAKLPFAVAPGMGINAFFTYTIILRNQVPWPVALGIVFWSGIIFLATSITPIRVKIANGIPENLRFASATGIGIFLTFIGLKNAGLVVADPVTFVKLGAMDRTSLFSLAGLALTIILLRRKNNFAFLAGISLVTALALISGSIHLPDKWVSKPDFDSVFMKMDIMGALKLSLLPSILPLFFTNLFDSISTLMGCSYAFGLKDENGEPLNLRKGMIVDSWASVTASMLGTSSGTAFLESTAGMEVGGRTGLTAIVTAFCFLPCLFLGPLASIVPAYATAPVLILIGALMFRSVMDIKLSHLEDLIPAFLTIILIPLTFSITQGIMWGFVSHVLLYGFSGRIKEIKPILFVLAAMSVVLLAVDSAHAVEGVSMSSELIRSKYQPGEVTRLCDSAIKETQLKLDQVAKIPSEKRNARNTLLAFEEITSDFSDAVTPLSFMSYVSTDEGMSKEGSDCQEKVGQFSVSIYTRKDLYEVLREQKNLNAHEARLHKETIQSFEENGLKLPDDKLKKVRELKQLLSTMESQFETNLNNDKSFVEYALEELDGVPRDFIEGLKKTTEGKYIVPTNEPNYVRLMDNASRAETRRKMQSSFENKAVHENVKLLEKGIEIRRQIADFMGYKNWADYRLHDRMAKDSQTVLSFLNGLKGKLSQRNKQDLAKLLDLKRATESGATELKSWDIRYYSNQLKKKDFSLDEEVIRQYFPADVVLKGLFEVYSKLLGLTFHEEKDAKVWADGVKLYRVHDKKSRELIGYFYTDFIPRAGKYGHAAAFSLVSGRVMANGKYSHPVSAIVANFSTSESGKPALLPHHEVETIFHEFGHIMHQVLTRAPYSSLSGSNVDQDFVEAPSQMLENWVFSPEILNLLSGHYEDHTRKLSQQLIRKIVEARDFNQGYFYTRQLLLGLIDMTYHTSPDAVNTTQVYRDLHKELVGVDALPDSHFPATFGHLMGGYDAGYYGYLWSEVYAADMFTRFEKSGLTNLKVGSEYRKTILEKGKMVEAFDLLREFLGREPDAKAFYKKLHIH